jgi:hypothetical protein
MRQLKPSKLQETCLDAAIAAIKDKGFGFIKFELEANFNRRLMSCTTCTTSCTSCDGTGNTVVDDRVVKCPECKYGVRTCNSTHYDFSSTAVCNRFMREEIGAEIRSTIVYGNFYRDGSVDSEYTVTLPIESVRLIIPIIRAFIKLGELNGNGIDTAGAGMHIALLNSPQGRYPEGNHLDGTKLAKMGIAMNKLMPALFFLGSADYRTRSLHYRMPHQIVTSLLA